MKERITQSDYVKANRRASRSEEIAAHGRPVGFRRVHESKKSYNREKMKAGLKSLPDFYTSPRSRQIFRPGIVGITPYCPSSDAGTSAGSQ